MEDLVFKVLGTLSIPGVVGLIAYLLYKSGVFTAIADKIKGKTDNSKIAGLEKFQFEAENNHFTDLDRLLKDNEKLWTSIEAVREQGAENSKNIAYILGRLNGSNKE